jgi:tRNA-dihydrouridine synthase
LHSQIAGYKTEQLVKACQVINETVDVDFVDLNMGCPIDMLFNKVYFNDAYSVQADGILIFFIS